MNERHYTHHEAIRVAQDEAWANGHTLDPFRVQHGFHRAYCVDCSAIATVSRDEDGKYIRAGRALSSRCSPLF